MNNPEYKDLSAQIQKGFREGVRKAVAEHKKAHHEISIWQNGKVVKIPPEKI